MLNSPTNPFPVSDFLDASLFVETKTLQRGGLTPPPHSSLVGISANFILPICHNLHPEFASKHNISIHLMLHQSTKYSGFQLWPVDYCEKEEWHKKTVLWLKLCPHLNKAANEAGRTERMPGLCTMESRFFLAKASNEAALKEMANIFSLKHWLKMGSVHFTSACSANAEYSLPRLYDTFTSVCSSILVLPPSNMDTA